MVPRMVNMDALSQLFLRWFGKNRWFVGWSQLFDLSISTWRYMASVDFVCFLFGFCNWYLNNHKRFSAYHCKVQFEKVRDKIIMWLIKMCWFKFVLSTQASSHALRWLTYSTYHSIIDQYTWKYVFNYLKLDFILRVQNAIADVDIYSTRS